MARMSRPARGTDFDALAAAERPVLVRAARRILGDATEAEDVVQETLAAVWQRLPAVSRRKLKAYLYRSVQFNALKRRTRRKERVSLDAVPEAPAPEREAEYPDEMIDPVELERALEGLPERQRVVLRMKYYLGLTFREIGEVLAISANTAASRCRYALAALRRTLTRKRTGSKGKGGERT